MDTITSGVPLDRRESLKTEESPARVRSCEVSIEARQNRAASCRGVAQPGCAPALGARCLILAAPFPACISIVSNKPGNLLFVHS